MSHVVSIQAEVRDLEALKVAAARLGLEFNEGQRTHRWYGTSVGDYPLPTGFTVDDLGKCEHAISVPGNHTAYEIGVVKRRDGVAGYELLYDLWQGGYGLVNHVGRNCNKLVQEYSRETTRRAAIRDGWNIESERTLQDGSLQLVLAR